MNLNSMRAAWSLEDETVNLGPEETIEVCNSVIAEAERIKDIAKEDLDALNRLADISEED